MITRCVTEIVMKLNFDEKMIIKGSNDYKCTDNRHTFSNVQMHTKMLLHD